MSLEILLFYKYAYDSFFCWLFYRFCHVSYFLVCVFQISICDDSYVFYPFYRIVSWMRPLNVRQRPSQVWTNQSYKTNKNVSVIIKKMRQCVININKYFSHQKSLLHIKENSFFLLLHCIISFIGLSKLKSFMEFFPLCSSPGGLFTGLWRYGFDWKRPETFFMKSCRWNLFLEE